MGNTADRAEWLPKFLTIRPASVLARLISTLVQIARVANSKHFCNQELVILDRT